MANSVTKGNKLQVTARKILEADGYSVHTAVRSVQRRGPIWISQTTDIFNAFDLIATRIDPPRSLRFIQVTTGKSVSERVKKVDPVPINPGIASVEIWAYIGGRRRHDRRFKDRKVWLPRNYFQIYFKERNWEPDKRDRVAPDGTSVAGPRAAEPVVTAPPLVARSRRRRRMAISKS